MLKKIWDAYDKFEVAVLTVGIIVMAAILFIQVFYRVFFHDGIKWAEELARILFIWVSWLGISLGEKKGEHIKVSMITDRLKGNTQKIVLIISDVLSLAILLVFLVAGVDVGMKIFAMGTKTAALRWPRWILYVSMPYSCLVMSLRLIKEIILRFQGKEVYE